jgi:hypothetical protein
MATPTLFCASLGNLIIYVATDETPVDADWDEYLALINAAAAAAAGGSVRVAVFADGATPTATQRKRVANLVRTQQHKSAVISDRLAARAVVTGLRWLGVEIRPFSPKAIEAAFDYLGLTSNERAWLVTTERRFRARLTRPGSIHP